jgi:hypothetical protein
MIGYNKHPITKEFKKNVEEYGFTSLQNYIPIYREFFTLNSSNFNAIQLNHQYCIKRIIKEDEYNPHTYKASVQNATNGKTKTLEVFIKEAPIIDPFKLLTGELKMSSNNLRTLPYFENQIETGDQIHNKISNPYNSSYIDGLFNYINGELLDRGFIHGIEYYGSFLSIKKEYTFNITDDLDYLVHSKEFRKNTNVLYTLSRDLFNLPQLEMTDHNVDPLDAGESTNVLDAIELEDGDVEHYTEPEYTSFSQSDFNIDDEAPSKNGITSNTHSSGSSSNYSTYSDDSSDIDEGDVIPLRILILEDGTKSTDDPLVPTIEESNPSEDDGSSGSDEDSCNTIEDSEDEVSATIPLFPVQMICIEKCTDTLDALLIDGILNEDELFSCMFQIIMILLTYQKTFDFTHNDLHTNNIVFVNTHKKFLIYTYNAITYKIPTYKKIYKIIDFGRSIFTVNNRLMYSDHFNKGEDAYSQYNFASFYNPDKPVVEPNYSFDLCRLSCSMIDLFISDHSDLSTTTPFSRFLLKLCQDDMGNHILYKTTGEERYPNFKLYKMISRTVHNHTPDNILRMECFLKFVSHEEVNVQSNQSVYINLDTLIPSIKNLANP